MKRLLSINDGVHKQFSELPIACSVLATDFSPPETQMHLAFQFRIPFL